MTMSNNLEKKLTAKEINNKVKFCIYVEGPVHPEVVSVRTGIPPESVQEAIQNLLDNKIIKAENMYNELWYSGSNRFMRRVYLFFNHRG